MLRRRVGTVYEILIIFSFIQTAVNRKAHIRCEHGLKKQEPFVPCCCSFHCFFVCFFTLIFLQENEKLYLQMKAQQAKSKANEEAMFKENQRLLNELAATR